MGLKLQFEGVGGVLQQLLLERLHRLLFIQHIFGQLNSILLPFRVKLFRCSHHYLVFCVVLMCIPIQKLAIEGLHIVRQVQVIQVRQSIQV